MIHAIIFDLDGVLCDLVQVHRKALDKALSEVCGYTIKEEEFWKYYNGIPSNVKLNMLVNRGILNPNDKEKVWKLKQENTVESLNECLQYDTQKISVLRYLKTDGLDLVCVSNSIRKTIEIALERTGQSEFMKFILGNEDFGEKPKPDPFCYKLAISKLLLTPKECLIVEDSEKGISAARGSGANVLEVENPEGVTLDNIYRMIKNANRK
jgi:HAD superfamily hydrolase (TIGR01509 family)